MSHSCDYLVIGSGLAGLAFALKAARQGQVLICTKTDLHTTNTAMAQGGIAAVMAENDSFEKHIQDTLTAGAGLCDERVVRAIVEQGPERIGDLIEWGVRFDLEANSAPALTREGGHSVRRILHVADHTGQEVHSQLLQRVKEHPNIRVLEHHFVLDLLLDRHLEPRLTGLPHCLGAYFLNKQTNEIYPITAQATILATGGAGKVYLYTSNWSGATGDGIAVAHRAGCRVIDLEFMQFHPTCLYHPNARNFLISEALRGEGGELVDTQGQAFMHKYHSLASLAPRDIVARSIDFEMKKSAAPCVYLDMTHKSKEFLQKRFPQIYTKCLEFSIDISRTPIPVVPAAHYLCGGVMTDIFGHTDVAQLYAIGETACTGLHGANRLASNSLLECLVLAHNAAQDLAAQKMDHAHRSEVPKQSIPAWNSYNKVDADELVVISHMWEEIRRLMWNYVGIVRTDRRLARAKHRLTNILQEIHEYYAHFKTHPDIEELRNIALVAKLTVDCALRRKESRGIHYNLDYLPKSVATD